MATSKKFSELPAASSVGNGDLFAIAHEDAQAETGYVSQKLTAAQAGQKVNGDTEYPTSLPSFPENGQNPFAALEKLNSDIIGLYPVNTASGSIATFDTSLALPLVECKAEIVAQQAGSGTPSPSNVRSISGFDSVNLTKTGKNLFDKSKITVGERFNTMGTGNVSNTYSRSDWILVKPNTKYYIQKVVPNPSGYSGVFWYDKDKNFISAQGGPGTVGTGINLAVTSPSNAYYVGLNCYVTEVDSVQLELGETATAYEPYNGQTATVNFGQTVYGGTINLTTGLLRVTHGYKDLGDFTWRKSSSGIGRFYASSSRTEFPYLLTKTAQMLCSMYAFDGYSSSLQNIYGPNGTFRYWYATTETAPSEIYVCDESKDTLDATQFKDAMSGVQLVYELETPIEITDLTPANFTTIAGEQNIFADCGDVTVGFKQGIQEYIDAKIAETQALIL